MELVPLLEALIKFDGSDLHLQAGAAPMIRVGGELRPDGGANGNTGTVVGCQGGEGGP